MASPPAMQFSCSVEEEDEICHCHFQSGFDDSCEPDKEKRALWSRLRKRSRSFNEDSAADMGEERSPSRRKTKLFQDTELLHRGIDEVVSSVSEISHILMASAQEVEKLGETKLSNLVPLNPPSASRPASMENVEANAETPKPKLKLREQIQTAVTMASKAKLLERELESVRLDLCFMRERCALLDEENRRLRDDGVHKSSSDVDDLVRLQLEALLAEKGRLMQENAILKRENECLHERIQYHHQQLHDAVAELHDHDHDHPHSHPLDPDMDIPIALHFIHSSGTRLSFSSYRHESPSP